MEDTLQEVVSSSPRFLSRGLESFIETQELSEARRLLYVALTRASKSLFLGISYRGKKEPDYTNKGVFEQIRELLAATPQSN